MPIKRLLQLNAKKAAIVCLLGLLLGTGGFSNAVAASTLDTVKTRNVLVCGIHSSAPGMAIRDQGQWRGLEADFCRAVASATLGQSNRVRFVPFALEKGYTALQSGEVDLLVRELPIDIGLEARTGLLFSGPLYYRSHAFAAGAESALYSLTDVANERVCAVSGETTEQLRRSISVGEIGIQLVELSSAEAVAKAYEQNRCELISAENKTLHYIQSLLNSEIRTRTLPGIYNISATGPLVRGDDMQWYKTVRATLGVLLIAEDLEINRKNVGNDIADWSQLSITGLQLGLKKDWHQSVVKQVGNYAMIYDAHLGENSSLNMPRGINRLSKDGGLHTPYSFD